MLKSSRKRNAMRRVKMMRNILAAGLALTLIMPPAPYAGNGIAPTGGSRASELSGGRSVFRDFFIAPIPTAAQYSEFITALTSFDPSTVTSFQNAVSNFLELERDNLSPYVLASARIIATEQPDYVLNPDNAVKLARALKFE